MKHALRLAVLLLCTTLSTFAQTALSNASISGNFTGFSGGGGWQPAVLASASYQVTQRVTGAYWELSVPAFSRNYNLGVGTYTLPLSSLLGKTISSKLLFDASAIPVAFSGGLGEVVQLGITHAAGIAGVSFGLPVSESTTLNVLQVYGVFGGGHESGVFSNVSSSSFTMATGLTVHLAPLGAQFKHRFVSKNKAHVRLGRCEQC
jgi:hypothetical protein